jgi:hypothetical protein
MLTDKTLFPAVFDQRTSKTTDNFQIFFVELSRGFPVEQSSDMCLAKLKSTKSK